MSLSEVEKVAAPESLDDPALYFDREISLLPFQRRALDARPDGPSQLELDAQAWVCGVRWGGGRPLFQREVAWPVAPDYAGRPGPRRSVFADLDRAADRQKTRRAISGTRGRRGLSISSDMR